MPITSIAPKAISILGNPSSLVPIMVKDGVACVSLTNYAYNNGGKVEALDRGIDEFGTAAIWIGGIPFFKKLIDKTVYKMSNINPDIDIRIIRDKQYSDWAKKNAQGIINEKTGQTVLSAIEGSLNKASKAKGLYLGKIIASTALTLGSYFALTKFRQKTTQKRVEKEILGAKPAQTTDKNQQKSDKKTSVDSEGKNVTFNSVFAPFVNKQPSFKGLGSSLVDGILFNPVHNMKLIDAGISGQRLGQSRNSTELAEYAIKEGALFCFIYFLGDAIQKGVNSLSEKVFKKPIDLDIKVLMSEDIKNGLKNGKIAEELSKIPVKESNLTDVLDFIVKNPENIVVKAAKQSGIISTLKNAEGKEIVDVSKYISKDAFYGIANNLKKIDSYFSKSGINIESFMKKAKGLKVASVFCNVLSSCFVLGYVVPELMYGYREKKRGSKKFHVAEDIKNTEGVKA